jgi:serine/threonine protein kinase
MVAAAVPPRKIGRYEILGRLAIGGMAEVLLGRLRGPGGFERAVVVKRILPHLALDRTVVDMFLDEARIIANLRHPNLINVHELGHDGSEFFMVMEFLEGETVAGLCRRLAMRGEQLDFAVAAHVVAEACAGLHAAHEAKTPEGRALEIVHRDVTPQNIFVTYGGGVHVIDFGIATAVDRESRTEAGTVRGKFEYLAPEQIQSKPLDRRADVFSLGVVLLELASGRRVYKRESHAATLMAILSEPPPSLCALRPGAPPELEAICFRALAKSRGDRYPSAAEMRRALLAFVRKRVDEDMGESLAGRMREAFAERIAEKAELLRRVREGSEVETLPPAEVDVQVDIPVAEQPTVGTALSKSVTAPISVESPRARRRTLALAALVATGGIVTAAVATSAWWRPSASSSTGVARSADTATIAKPGASSPSPLPSQAPSPSFVQASSSPPSSPSASSSAAPPRPPSRARPGPPRPPVTGSPRTAPTLW